MTPKEFAKYLARDNQCLHCGLSDDTLIPQHRMNRGMGGSKQRHTPSNIIVMCSQFNGWIESNSQAAELAIRYGWKLPSWESSADIPVYEVISGKWFLLDEKFGRTDVTLLWG